MTETQAKKLLAEMLERFTAGSILHLLADLHRELAEQARQSGDSVSFRQCKLVENSLFVMGLGIDAAKPT